MASQIIPDLKRKFGLLRAFGPRKSWDAQAETFGLSAKTLRWWADGTATRAPGSVPDRHIDGVIGLMREAFPPSLSQAELRDLLFGEFGSFEAVLHAPLATSGLLNGVIERAGRTDRARLHVAPSDLELVERDDDAPEGVYALRIGQRFYLEFPVDRNGYALVIQHAQQSWAAIAIDRDEPIAQVRRGSYSVPAFDPAEQPRYMVERVQTGLHRFISIITTQPPPAAIIAAARNQTQFDTLLLGQLAGFLEQQPEGRRSIDVVTASIRPRPG